jgi:hypothetical protein
MTYVYALFDQFEVTFRKLADQVSSGVYRVSPAFSTVSVVGIQILISLTLNVASIGLGWYLAYRLVLRDIPIFNEILGIKGPGKKK